MDRFDSILDELEKELLQLVGDHAQQEARDTNLFKQSSSFKDKITTHPIQNGQMVISQASWSSYLEDGNNQGGAYIYPKNKKALKFFIGGQEIYSKKVRSHGPLPFMANAAEATEKIIPEIWNKISNKLDK